jgi:peptidyl-prolyl cis-trans isomerase D
MFDFVRKHTKTLMFVMFLLIIPSFVLFGIDGYNRMGDKGKTVARVGDIEISQTDWDNAHRNEVDRIRASNPSVDVKVLDSAEARYATLERIVKERVLAQAADNMKLQTSDAKLAQELTQNPTIASLRKPDGSLDMDRYKQLAASQGLTPEGLEARVRRDISVNQVNSGVQASGFAGDQLTAVSLNAFFDRREIQFVQLSPADFLSRVTVTDADIEGFYKSNQALFKAEESATVEYVVLDLDTIKKSISLIEGDVKTFYEQNVARLSGTQERRASHILINALASASASDKAKAKAQALELLTAVRKAPESFADVATKNSQDTGSATKGGDLDYFGRGAMVKPFEDAVFAMKKGDISDVVESDFGFHIIKLTDVKDPVQKTFEELRPTIEADLKTQQAKAKYAEMAEGFTNGVYEQADSLKPVAERYKLDIKTTVNLQRQPGAGAKGVLTNAKLLSAIFNADAIEKKRNTEAVEIGPNQLAAARVTQYAPARVLPFADVRSGVKDKLVNQRALELAKKEGTDKLAQWKANPGAAQLPAAVVVSRDQPQVAPSLVLDAALRADSKALPVWTGVELGILGYAVVKVNAILPRTGATPDSVKQERSQYAQAWTAAESQAYLSELRTRFKTQIKVAKPASTLADRP